ncbi:MAG: mechanosensitive ion channel [Paracoccaceae bacterium]|jgi:small conductance mechanosensitive channel|nr:mechanosensitive ion channel [Paracoccaceae bacterium]MDP7186450.1 mechanosensitive ion channel [Paracoccaceae bacterium]
MWESLVEQIGPLEFYGTLVSNALKALVIIVIGWIASGWVKRMIKRRVMASDALDDTIGSFVASIVRWIILLMVFVAILGIFGIEATSLVAVMGAATLAIGLALQGTLGDLAAGFMLVLFRPYSLGQYVSIGGTSGTVKDLNLFFTVLVTPDNVQITMPNGQAWGAIITNYSANDIRRLDLTFGIDYADDPDKAIAILAGLAKADDRVHADPEPWIRLVNLGDSSVDIGCRFWCNADDYWELKWHLLKAAKAEFDAQGISIPYPHQVLVQRSE